MQEVYSGILKESIDNLDQLEIIINAFTVQMSDGERMEVIQQVERQLSENYNNLRDFNEQSAVMSLQRAKSIDEANVLRKIYGL